MIVSELVQCSCVTTFGLIALDCKMCEGSGIVRRTLETPSLGEQMAELRRLSHSEGDFYRLKECG